MPRPNRYKTIVRAELRFKAVFKILWQLKFERRKWILMVDHEMKIGQAPRSGQPTVAHGYLPTQGHQQPKTDSCVAQSFDTLYSLHTAPLINCRSGSLQTRADVLNFANRP